MRRGLSKNHTCCQGDLGEGRAEPEQQTSPPGGRQQSVTGKFLLKESPIIKQEMSHLEIEEMESDLGLGTVMLMGDGHMDDDRQALLP